MKTKPNRKQKKPIKSAGRAAPVSRASRLFPIVGIGASAGGLETLELFLGRVPARSGMAFVIVQHLDPTHRGVMPELLQRATRMKVSEVKDGTRVRPDCVYVIPRNKDLSIANGVLHLFPPASRALHLPINYFFRSLALDQKERSIGVVLSGMGSDGTLGARMIKEKEGLVLVQEPSTAKFDSMPSSVIDAGLADVAAPVEELPGRILSYLQQIPRVVTAAETLSEDKIPSAVVNVVLLLRAHTGHDFSLYKRNILYRRIERRMGIHKINKMSGYVRHLQNNPQELDLLFKELLIGVTSFFRDPSAWEQLVNQAIPTLVASRSSRETLRAWVAGCSTGEEAYSLAIALKEAVDNISPKKLFTIQIFATDLDRHAIDKARQGVFAAASTASVSEQRLRRFFIKEEGHYRISKEIREMVIFAPQNLVMDPPYTSLDILSCRNLLIYLTSEVQKKLIPLFHYTLRPGGILFLGSAESVGTYANLFEPLSRKSGLFRKSETVVRPETIEFPSSFSENLPTVIEASRPVKVPVSLESAADRFILQRYSPPAVVTTDKGDIIYVSGHTGKYLEPAAGKANWNFFAMARDGLRYELASAFQEAIRQKDAVALHGLKVGTSGGWQYVDVTIQRLDEPAPLKGLLMIVFIDAAVPAGAKVSDQQSTPRMGSRRRTELEQELVEVRNESRATHEGMLTTQEELRSANEELQSTNEELQSANEELTTSKEEMQSMNEELQTVNAELQVKVEELSRTSNDMQNLLNSTNIATLFLDNDLNVRRFTPQATKIIKLIPADVGRPITDLASELRYSELAEDARETLRTLAIVEKPIGARGGRWFTMRIMPYRTLDNRIDGVVITFTDIAAGEASGKRISTKK